MGPVSTMRVLIRHTHSSQAAVDSVGADVGAASSLRRKHRSRFRSRSSPPIAAAVHTGGLLNPSPFPLIRGLPMSHTAQR